MNALVNFRLCTLTDEELVKAVDAQTDALAEKGAFTRHVPALPNDDYDLLVGELVFRFHERLEKDVELGEKEIAERYDAQFIGIQKAEISALNSDLEKANAEIIELRKKLADANEAIAEIEEDANNRKEQWKEERKQMREEMRKRY